MMKRFARYLVGRARMVWEYQWQGIEELRSYSDSDWAGCKRTARSTSCGVVMRGMHHIKSWCVTQKRVTLSSAEAELGALVNTTSETIGILQMAVGLGREVTGEVFVDSNAALAVVNRKGCGKLRHVRVGQLWAQQLTEDDEVKFRKVLGDENPADLSIKYLTRLRIDKLLALIYLRDEEGKAEEDLDI